MAEWGELTVSKGEELSSACVLTRAYEHYVLECDDASGIASKSTLRLMMDLEHDGYPKLLFDRVETVQLVVPAERFIMQVPLLGARRVWAVFSKPVKDDVLLRVYGFNQLS